MASFNKVILAGNLTRDPELRFTPKGTAVAKIGLAINRVWKTDTGESKEEVTFVDVEVFGRTAENVSNYLRKGSPILMEGRLRLDSWEDKQTNQKRNRLVVVAETVQFLSSQRAGDSGGTSAPEAAARPTRPSSPAPSPSTPPSAAEGAEESPTEDDVPF